MFTAFATALRAGELGLFKPFPLLFFDPGINSIHLDQDVVFFSTPQLNKYGGNFRNHKCLPVANKI